MGKKSVHEPEAQVMTAAEVWDDAHQVARVLRRRSQEDQRVVHLRVSLATLLSALDELEPDELMMVRERVQKRLAA